MTVAWYLGIAFCLSIVAFCAAILGIGGGVLYTPIQIFFGIDIHEAASTSLFLIIFLSLGATIVYRRAGKVDWLMAIVLEIFTVTGGFLGGYFSKFVSSNILIAILVGVLALAGAAMVFRKKGSGIRPGDGGAWYRWHRRTDGEDYALNVLLAFPLCLAVGVISSMVGVGGGILKVPMMTLIFGIPIDIAIATSGFMVGITAIGGFAGHLMAGHWNWELSLILAPGVFIGAGLGARSMLSLDKSCLKMAFGVFMLLIAAGLIVNIL